MICLSPRFIFNASPSRYSKSMRSAALLEATNVWISALYHSLSQRSTSLDSRSSTPSFYDMGPPNKALPLIPDRNEIPAPLLPPLKHRRFIAGNVAPDPDYKQQRPLSWSEMQIHTLQRQVQTLRQDVIDQKRHAIEKDRIIAAQQQKIAQHLQRESKREDLLKHFANNMQVALEDLQDNKLWEDEVSDSLLDDIITIVNDIGGEGAGTRESTM